MSTKKDKITSKDNNFMRLALNLARARKGLTGDNPSVGCVITKNEKIISIGQTGYNGRPHAETNAINNSFENLKDSKMYVTLEPCNHYGQTPPCTKKIISSGINKVFYSINDIDNKITGKSLKILTKKNIKVEKGILKKEVKDFYASYIKNRKKKLPYVTAKIAVSKNKLIYSEKERKITDTTSDKLSHYLRYKNDAILITSRTLNTDNPKLNCRLKNYESFSPIRIILDKNLEINLNSNIFKTSKENNTIIFYKSSNNLKINILKKKGINLIKLKLNSGKNFDFKIIFKKLYLLGIRNLLIEGGDKLTKNLLKSDLIDCFYLFKSPKNLLKGKKSVFFTSSDILNKKYDNNFKISSKLAKDTISIYKRKNV